MAFDLLMRDGILVHGTGTSGRPADVGVSGDRIVADGDPSVGAEAVIVNGAETLRVGVETGARPGRLLRRA